MGWFRIGNAKEVPEELPELISEEIEKELSRNLEKFTYHPPKSEPIEEPKPFPEQTIISREQENPEDFQREIESDQSFFAQLEKELSGDSEDLYGLNETLNERISSSDVLEDMKTHWHNKKKLSEVDTRAQEHKAKILEKISNLKSLERSWQECYFDLIEKESEIKAEEKDLKKMVKDFTQICNQKKRIHESFETGWTQTNKKTEEFSN